MVLTEYTILHKGKVLYKNLTEEEYFDKMEDLSIEYYQKGFPRPQDLETKITKYQEVIMAVRSRVGLSGNGFIEGKPKKSRQGNGKHTKYAATSRNGKRKMYRGQGRG